VRSAAAASAAAALLLAALGSGVAHAQTPDQQNAWEVEKQHQLAEQRARAERLAAQRAARQADVMGWVRTLDPMSSGGWDFRAAAGDATWAAWTTEHQLQRSGSVVTIWLRQEFAEPQTDPRGGTYLSFVQRLEFDCDKQKLRPRLLIYYGDNNLRGATQQIDMDAKTTQWGPIVPGTLDETNFQWACSPKGRR
jgi:hypothetical protein